MLVVSFMRLMETCLAAYRGHVVDYIFLDTIPNQRAEIEVLLAACIVSDTPLSIIDGALGVKKAESTLRECVVLVALDAEKRWLSTRKDFQVYFQPADSLLIS